VTLATAGAIILLLAFKPETFSPAKKHAGTS
jgi:hypothetical protein